MENKVLTLNSVPRRWYSFLVKRWWFRRLILRHHEVEETGVERVIPMVKGPPIRREYQNAGVEAAITLLDEGFSEGYVKRWRGKLCIAPAKKVSFTFNQSKDLLAGLKGFVVERAKRRERLYVKDTLEYLWESGMADELFYFGRKRYPAPGATVSIFPVLTGTYVPRTGYREIRPPCTLDLCVQPVVRPAALDLSPYDYHMDPEYHAARLALGASAHKYSSHYGDEANDDWSSQVFPFTSFGGRLWW